MKLNERGSATGVTFALIALILSAMALVLSWIAFNRTGSDLEDRIQREVNESMTNVEQGTQDAADSIEQGTNEAREEAAETIAPDETTDTNEATTEDTTTDDTTNQ